MEHYDVKIFQKDLEKMEIDLSAKQIEQFLRYYELLIDWNKRINLTAITVYQDVLKKHFIDSLSLTKVCDLRQKCHMIDVGTGAGFPGLALKIAFPEIHVTLLDSLHKRIQFLDTVIEELKLENVQTVHGRAEDFAKQGKLREAFDICVSRAVANFSILSEYCLPYVRKGGLFIAYKSEKVASEIEGAGRAIALLGGSIKEKVEFTLPYSDIYRSLVVIQKIERTPGKYPRKAGIPSKEPL